MKTARDLRGENAALTKRMTVLASKNMTLEEKAEFEVLEDAVEKRKERIARAEGRGINHDELEMRSFVNYLRHGLYPQIGYGNGITPEDRAMLMRPSVESRDMGEGLLGGAYPGSVGGFLAPVLFANKVNAALKFYSDLFISSTIYPAGAGTPLAYPNVDDTSVSGELVREATQTSEADVANIGGITFSSYRFSSKIIKLSLELVQDSFFGFEDWLANQLAIRIVRGANPYLTTGAGVTGQEPMGIVTAAVASGHPVIGNDLFTTPDPTSEIGYTDLVALESSVDPQYRRRGSWMAHSDTVQFLRNLRDKSGRPLFPGLDIDAAPGDDGPSFSGWIFGHQVFLNNDMSPIGPGAKCVLFGDLKRYVIRRNQGLIVQRLTERWADYGQVAFLATDRMDGQLLTAGNPVKFLENNF